MTIYLEVIYGNVNVFKKCSSYALRKISNLEKIIKPWKIKFYAKTNYNQSIYLDSVMNNMYITVMKILTMYLTETEI